MTTYKTLDNGIKIVEYQDSLAQAVADLFNYEREDWGGSSSVNTAEQIIRNHSTGSNVNVYIAMDGDIAAGYCRFSKYYKDADTLYVGYLDVRPDYQNKKIGKALVLQCVERTRELGYSRLDLHTWPGNTKAMPLYKKCGFLWEDRGDTTHLVNFIPGVLDNPLFADFFSRVDWYEDNAKDVGEIVPDEVKRNKFGLFEYRWEKGADMLALGFERSGRILRMIETSDYKIELIAENHELAFGMSYGCSFIVENKSGKPLDIKINGQIGADGLIDLDYVMTDDDFKGKKELPARFYVGAIKEPQDKDKIHPRLLADVAINGQAVTFGLGIMIKFPLEVKLEQQRWLSQKGIAEDAFINIKSAMASDSTISFELPENSLASFEQRKFTVDISARGNAGVKVKLTPHEVGHAALPISFNIAANCEDISFNKDLHVANYSIDGAFAYETDEAYIAANGVWRLNLRKETNNIAVTHLFSNEPYAWLTPPKFGKPFEDEFGLIQPVVKMSQNGAGMIMEAEFASEKFRGLAVTQVITLSPSGRVTRCHRIKNNAQDSQPVMLLDGCFVSVSRETYFPYDGKITHNIGGESGALEGVDSKKLDENWVFEQSTNRPTLGICWPKEYRADTKWGEMIFFELDLGELAAGGMVETKPVEFACGIFPDFSSFRAYATQKYSDVILNAEPDVQIMGNGGNPFIAGDSVDVIVKYNRSDAPEGTVALTSQMFDTQTQENCGGETTEANNFTASVKNRPASGIGNFAVKLSLKQYEKAFERAVFMQCGKGVDHKQDGDTLVCSNGEITFKVSAAYAPVLFSLEANGEQWLDNKYPNHEPYAWWSPFIGGMRPVIEGMTDSLVLKEKISAEFAETCDNFGNKWKGIRTTLEINEHDEKKGITLHSYYLTLPGLPVLCQFFKYVNNTGLLQNEEMELEVFLDAGGELTDGYIDLVDPEKNHHRLHTGGINQVKHFDKLMKLSSLRKSSLYTYRAAKSAGETNYAYISNKVTTGNAEIAFTIPNGETYTSVPAFLIITEQNLTAEALDDLKRVRFYENN